MIIILHCNAKISIENIVNEAIVLNVTIVLVIDVDSFIHQAGVDEGSSGDDGGEGGCDTAYFNQIVMKYISIAKSPCKHENAPE